MARNPAGDATANDAVAALASAWQAVSDRHSELPAVIVGIGPGSRRGAKRRKLGHFEPSAWAPVNQNGARELHASSKALEEAMVQRRSERSAFAVGGPGITGGAGTLPRRKAPRRRGGVITDEGLAGSPLDVLAIVLHEAAHAPAYQRGGIKDASRQGRYHNQRFKKIVGQIGLQVDQDPPFGWPHNRPPHRRPHATARPSTRWSGR